MTSKPLLLYQEFWIIIAIVFLDLSVISIVQPVMELLQEQQLQERGAYIFAGISTVICLIAIWFGNLKLKQNNWKLVHATEINYSIEKTNSDNRTVTFHIKFTDPEHTCQKSFNLKQPSTDINRLETLLAKNLNQEQHEALLYIDPDNETNSTFQVGVTKRDIWIDMILVSMEIIATITGILLMIFQLNLLVGPPRGKLPTTEELAINTVGYTLMHLIGYIIIFNIILIGVTVGLILKSIVKVGLEAHPNYPTFYNPIKQEFYDLKKELDKITIYCQNCGKIISQKDSFCPYCRYTQKLR